MGKGGLHRIRAASSLVEIKRKLNDYTWKYEPWTREDLRMKGVISSERELIIIYESTIGNTQTYYHSIDLMENVEPDAQDTCGE